MKKKKHGNILVFLAERIDTLTHSTHMPLLPFYKTYKFVGWVLGGGGVGWGRSLEQFGMVSSLDGLLALFLNFLHHLTWRDSFVQIHG